MDSIRIANIFTVANPSTSTSVPVCVFCLKCTKSSSQENDVPLVIKLADRYFREQLKQNGCKNENQISLGFLDDRKLGCCSECYSILERFHETYHIMTCLELELHGILMKLEQVLELADGDPMTISNFRDWCLQAGKDMDTSMQFRRNFRRKSKLSRVKGFPRLVLGQLSTNTSTDSEAFNSTKAKESGIPREASSNEDVNICLDTDDNTLAGVPSPSASVVSAIMSDAPPSPPLVPSPLPSDSDSEAVDALEAPPAKRLKLEPGTQIQQSCSVISHDLIKSEHFSNRNAPKCTNNKNMDLIEPNSDLENAERARGSVQESITETLVETTELQENSTENLEAMSKPEMSVHADAIYQDLSTAKTTTNTTTTAKTTATTTTTPAPKYKIKCKMCPKPYPRVKSREVLNIHTRYKHTNGQGQLAQKEFSQLGINEFNIMLQDITLEQHFCPHEPCEDSFALPEEREAHTKLHGKFSCHSCNSIFTYVDDLAEHEMKYCDNAIACSNSLSVICPRCEKEIRNTKVHRMSHYLEAHLFPEAPQKLEATCPVCKKVFKEADRVPIMHYVKCHDISRLSDPSKVFPCNRNDCSAYFLLPTQRKHHGKQVHFNSKRQTSNCEKCTKSFKTTLELRNHAWVAHPVKGWKLTKLGKDGPTISEFVYMKKSRNVCRRDGCHKRFLTIEQHLEHSKLHQKIKCNFCHVTSNFAPDLAIHELKHHANSRNDKQEENGNTEGNTNASKGKAFRRIFQITCPRCPFNTSTERSYVEHHLESHLKLVPDRIQCPICKKPAAVLGRHNSKLDLKQWIYCHYMEHHDTAGLDDIKTCNVDQCGAYFRTGIQLHRHEVAVHWDGQEQCPDCKKMYSNMERLKRHRFQSHKVREEDFHFVCPIPECKKRHEREFELEYHAQVHESLKGYGEAQGIEICDVCGKACLGTGALVSHKKMHEDNSKNFMCDLCGKNFQSKNRLEMHILHHKGPDSWEFLCNVCSKKCFSRGKLEEHMRTHMPDKELFVCNVCGNKYAHRHNWRLHMKNKHPHSNTNNTSSSKVEVEDA